MIFSRIMISVSSSLRKDTTPKPHIITGNVSNDLLTDIKPLESNLDGMLVDLLSRLREYRQCRRESTHPSTVSISYINNFALDRDILKELLTWESTQKMEETDISNEENLNRKLITKYDIYIHEKEEENIKLHSIMQILAEVPAKNKKIQQPGLDSLPAPDPSLPPFQKIKNEPYGDNTAMKFQGDEVLDKLNEFADSTLEFGTSLLKRIKTEAFGLSSNQE